MGPYRNPVEARYNRSPARQYVSETHDHKPDAPVRNGTVADGVVVIGINTALRQLNAGRLDLARESLEGVLALLRRRSPA